MVKFFIRFFIIGFFCAQIQAAEDKHEKDFIVLEAYPKATYRKEIPQDNGQILEKSFQALKSRPTGQRLLESITEKLGSRTIQIVPSTGGHAFSPPQWDHDFIDESCGQKGRYLPTPSFIIEINFSLLSREEFLSRISTFGLNPLESVGHSCKPFFEIGTIVYPFFLTLGHELIHLLHFLDDSRRFRMNLTSELDITFWDLYGGDNDRSMALWKNLEEQITVIGTPKGDAREEISEAALLVEFGISPRYAYQGKDSPFYEHPSLIEKIFKRFTNDQELTRERWEFDREKAVTSRLNPADLKKDNAELYKAPAGEPLAADIRSSETQEARRRAVLEKLAARQALRKEEAAAKKKE